MNQAKAIAALAVILPVAATPRAFPANHREAPITALDHKAKITDVYAFVSYADPTKVTAAEAVSKRSAPREPVCARRSSRAGRTERRSARRL